MEGLSVANVLADVGTVLTSVVETCTSNPVTTALIGMSLVGAGIGLFRKFLHVRWF